MKSSQFNSFFIHDQNIIGYNAYCNDFIIMDQYLYDLFIAAKNEDNIVDLIEIHPDFYNVLLAKNFITDKNIDELQLVKNLVKSIDQEQNDIYELIINPTMNCNFKCWYCYETHIKDSKMSSETINNVIKFIENTISSNPDLKQFYLSWFGGEPMLYYDKVISPILKKAHLLCKGKNIDFTSNFTTNGLLIDEKRILECKSLGVDHFQITLDGHRERHDKVRFINKEKGSYDTIIKNIKLILKNKLFVNIRLNISDETLDGNLEKIVNDFSDLTNEDRHYMNFSFHKVWQEEKNIDNDINHLVNYFKQDDFSASTIHDSDNVRNSCYADKKNHATINFNGDVFKCTARDFKSEDKEGVLLGNGTIEWNQKYYNRMDSKFKNTPCLECKILPICNGSCSQNAVENLGTEFCVHDFDEDKKLEVVKNKFLNTIS
ncbi:radical SAM/SPASM domain-containing protein [Empedobacter brevis]|uniref:radical SAM/SPASM domain-containing protein n=1 Tax=Empedobacter brevis TaxID=247 RepID=UPI0028AA5805|nr:radical SAM protein [Empedobacter brevis]